VRRLAGWVVATHLLPRNHAHTHLSLPKYGAFPGLWTVVSNRASVRVFHLRNQFIHKVRMRDWTKKYGVYLLYYTKIRININKDCISLIFEITRVVRIR
jgi:hypothetical protein